MRIQSEPMIFGLTDPDPAYNNGFKIIFILKQNIKQIHA